MEGVVILLVFGFAFGFIMATFLWYLAKKHAKERWERVEIVIDKLSKLVLSKDDINLRTRKDFIDARYEFSYDESKWSSYVKYYKETYNKKWYIHISNSKTVCDTPREMSLEKPTTYTSQMLELYVTDGYISSFRTYHCSESTKSLLYLLSDIRLLEYVVDYVIGECEHKKNIQLIIDQLYDNLPSIVLHESGPLRFN